MRRQYIHRGSVSDSVLVTCGGTEDECGSEVREAAVGTGGGKRDGGVVVHRRDVESLWVHAAQSGKALALLWVSG